MSDEANAAIKMGEALKGAAGAVAGLRLTPEAEAQVVAALASAEPPLVAWLNGTPLADLPDSTEATLRREFDHLAAQHMRLVQSVAAMHRDLLEHAEGLASQWSPDTHLHGYLMGRSREAAVIGSVLGAITNACIVQGAAKAETT